MQRCCNNQYLLFAHNWTSQSHVLSCWPVHFGHHRNARRTQKSVFAVHMISAVTLPNGSALEVFTGRDLQCSPSLDGPLCKPLDSERADVGSALMQKNNESPITFIHAEESSSISIRWWWLDVCQSFSSGRLANVSTAENDHRGKACEKGRLCALTFVCMCDCSLLAI